MGAIFMKWPCAVTKIIFIIEYGSVSSVVRYPMEGRKRAVKGEESGVVPRYLFFPAPFLYGRFYFFNKFEGGLNLSFRFVHGYDIKIAIVCLFTV